MPSTTPSGFVSTKCRSRPRRCSRRCGERRREKRDGWGRRASPTSRGLNPLASPLHGREATAKPSRACMLRLPSFAYLQPRTLAEALRMKRDAGPEGMFVAGGTDLYPNMKRRHQEPNTVISLMRIPELRRLEGENVGTCVTLTALSNFPTFQHSAIGAAAPQHGHPRRQPLPRHPLQLLQPELRVAEVDRLLHEKGRCHLLGGALVAPVLGGQLVRYRTGDGGDRRRVPAGRPAG